MGARNWSGIYPSLPTPFDASGAVDLAALRRIVRFALAAGSPGLVCAGLAGEISRLTTSERMRLCGSVVEEADGAVPVGIDRTTDGAGVRREAP